MGVVVPGRAEQPWVGGKAEEREAGRKQEAVLGKREFHST